MSRGNNGLGKGGTKPRRNVIRDNPDITKPAIRRLARRGGVKRMTGVVYDNAQDAFKVFLVNIIRDAITYSEHAHRRLVTTMDVVLALKRNGHTVYGFGNPA